MRVAGTPYTGANIRTISNFPSEIMQPGRELSGICKTH